MAQDASDFEVVVDAHAVIGESPTWSPAERALYWIDVKKPALHRFDPARGISRTWSVDSDIGAFALLEGNAALVALRRGIHRLDLDRGTLTLLATAPFDPRRFRFNEGTCDACGRFWVGVMFDPIEGAPPPEPASLHTFTLQDGLRPAPDAAELHNGMAWSEDGARFFLSHSYSGEIFVFEYHLDKGLLGARRVFARIPAGEGLPDGAAIDREGGYWCALHGGGRLRRFTQDGRVDRDILLPVSQPTMCAFGGDALDELYVTSASDGLTAAQAAAEPLAGAVLRVYPGVKGIERPWLAR